MNLIARAEHLPSASSTHLPSLTECVHACNAYVGATMLEVTSARELQGTIWL